VVVHTYQFSYKGDINRKIVVQSNLSTKGDPMSKITTGKRAEAMVQMIEPCQQTQGPEFNLKY
jgi:hypothetical protein